LSKELLTFIISKIKGTAIPVKSFCPDLKPIVSSIIRNTIYPVLFHG
jgi:hypothetical protein